MKTMIESMEELESLIGATERHLIAIQQRLEDYDSDAIDEGTPTAARCDLAVGEIRKAMKTMKDSVILLTATERDASQVADACEYHFPIWEKTIGRWGDNRQSNITR